MWQAEVERFEFMVNHFAKEHKSVYLFRNLRLFSEAGRVLSNLAHEQKSRLTTVCHFV